MGNNKIEIDILIKIAQEELAEFGANTQSAPIVTAHLAEIAILARMLFGAFLRYFGNINFSRYAGQFNKGHGYTPVAVEFRPV